MATAIKARYINGAFMPETAIEIEEGALVSLSYAIDETAAAALSASEVLRRAEDMLDEADCAFEGAFGEAGWDAPRIKRGSRLAWGAAWMSAKWIARERGLACQSRNDAIAVMMRLGGVNERDATGGDLALFTGICVDQGFYESGYGLPGDPKIYFPTEDWQMLDGLGYVRDLVRTLCAIGAGEEKVA